MNVLRWLWRQWLWWRLSRAIRDVDPIKTPLQARIGTENTDEIEWTRRDGGRDEDAH